MKLPGLLSTRPHRLAGLALADAALYAMHARNPVDNWSAEWMYIFNAFAVVTCWTLIKLMLTHGFVENPYESLMAEMFGAQEVEQEPEEEAEEEKKDE